MLSILLYQRKKKMMRLCYSFYEQDPVLLLHEVLFSLYLTSITYNTSMIVEVNEGRNLHCNDLKENLALAEFMLFMIKTPKIDIFRFRLHNIVIDIEGPEIIAKVLQIILSWEER
jgi:hypothetical protein